jgi:AcrR family transcriptional regulator
MIIEGAAVLFAERGYSGVSMQEIGHSVGISASALYRHFRDKDDLLRAVMIDTLDEIIAVVQAHADDPPSARLERCLVDFVAWGLENPERSATFTRERSRLRGDAAAEPAKQDKAFMDAMVATVRSSGVALPTRAIVERVVGVIGVHGAFRPDRLPMPAAPLARFVAGALVPVLTGTEAVALAAGPLEGRSRSGRRWAPAPSRRQQILDAALPLFRQRGFTGVGVAELGEAAGIGGPNIYRYFASKDDILVDIHDRATERITTRLEDAIEAASGPEDGLRRMIAAFVHESLRSADLIVVMARAGGAVPAAEAARIERRRQAVVDLWVAVLSECRPDLSAAEVAALVATATAFVTFYPQTVVVRPSADDISASVTRLLLASQA